MKRVRSLIAVLISTIMIFSLMTIPSGAITVVEEGKSYTLRSNTPTTGDCHVLVIRVGFADYPVNDENDPAKSEETLLSYFDDTEDSVSRFYKTSSYGKLRLHCDRIFSYNAQFEREYYNGGNRVSEELLSETLNALQNEIDVDKYDSDSDGNLDFVCFDYAGPIGKWGTSWWSYVFSPNEVQIKDKRVSICTFLHGDLLTYIHEFGHILGVPDYYSTNDTHESAVMTFDMMCANDGDHNGFTKWCYGWLTDDDIAYVDEASGDTVVTLAPIETEPGDGKKIAVIAPAFTHETRFLDEYFLVEYDSGAGNNKAAFDLYSLEPGFRIFRVNAKAEYLDKTAEASFLLNNDALRSNLIHNTKNELDDVVYYDTQSMFFREGDSLEPLDYPNTGFAGESLYNSRLTGITFSDFVTGEHPSFKVSFSKEEVEQPEPKLTLSCESLNSVIKIQLTSDQILAQRRSTLSGFEAPYLMNSDGEKLTMNVRAISSRRFELSYDKISPAVEPETAYTLVIPEGFFIYGYEQRVPELRETVTTETFMSQTLIERYLPEEFGKRISNSFAVTDNTYGRIVLDSETATCRFSEYNFNGEKIEETVFDAPDYGGAKGQRLFNCTVYRLNDGNFAFCVYTFDNNYFTKIDRSGKPLSKTFVVSDSLVEGYANGISSIAFKPMKNGLYQHLFSSDYSSDVNLMIDFENEPRLIEMDADAYLSLSSDYYIKKIYQDEHQHLRLCDGSDREIADIILDDIFLGAFIEEGRLSVLSKKVIPDVDYNRIVTIGINTYDLNGALLSSEDITSNAAHLANTYQFERIVPTESGYFISYDDGIEKLRIVIATDKEWKKIGDLSFNINAPLVFLGECGLVFKEQYDEESGDIFCMVSLFHIGAYEIAPKRTERLLGDADKSGKVDVLDSTAVQRKLASLSVTDSFDKIAADVDASGKVSILDATYIQRFLASMDTPYPIGQPVQTDE